MKGDFFLDLLMIDFVNEITAVRSNVECIVLLGSRFLEHRVLHATL